MNSKFLLIITIGLLFFSCSSNTNKTLYIANTMADCVGVSPMKCLQVKDDGTPNWTYFYNAIEGFDYEEGFFYKLKVAVETIENPPADGSSLKYTLIEILDKSKIPLLLDQGSWLVTRIKDMDSFGRNPFIKIDLAQNAINGNTGCNRFSAKIDINDKNIKISEVSSTDMACNDAHIESKFLEALKNTTSYTLNEDKLQLRNQNNELLIECDYLKNE